MQILVPILGLHHDPKYFPDPERFDPERFSEEEKKERPHFCYLPFGEGPRMCIGKCHLSSVSDRCGTVRIATILRDGRLSNRGFIPGRNKRLPCSPHDQPCPWHSHKLQSNGGSFNLLATDFFFQILAHSVFKM